MNAIAHRVVERFQRTSAVKMSPFTVGYYDKLYAERKQSIVEIIRDGLDEDDIAALIKKYPTATDGELTEKASKKLDIGIDGWPIRGFSDAVTSSRALKSVGTSSSLSEPFDVIDDLVKEGIKVEFRMEGEWFEIGDDPMDRVEVPEFTYQREIERALKSIGANSVMVDWKMGHPMDPSYARGYDAIQYTVTAVWRVDWAFLTKRYGMLPFTEEFVRLLREIRAQG